MVLFVIKNKVCIVMIFDLKGNELFLRFFDNYSQFKQMNLFWAATILVMGGLAVFLCTRC